ncbi:class I SAM-dependent methyltransferase [Dactylosporangium sp. CA-139114]|uniref:class I SAM-dependent methyltransferase n=1 Tax=Dactylosporangium sp. CA-139114 TaxID=3239931 RepID=UPI003D958552
MADAAAKWTGRATAFADSYAHLCAHTAAPLLEAAGVTAGLTLLDAGTGSGTVAALAIARGAKVTAADAEPSMVALAAESVPEADVRLGRLPDLPFADAAFDAVVANFVVNHVPDPAAAVADLARVTKPGGRVAITVWPRPAPPLQQLWNDILAALDIEPAPSIIPDALNFPRTPDGVAGLLSQAGLRNVSSRTIEWSHHTDLESWWIGPANGMGALGEALARRDDQTRTRARHEYERLATPFLHNGDLILPTAALLAWGDR